MTNDQQLATTDYLADQIRGLEIRMLKRWNDMDSRMIKRLNGMADVPEDLTSIDIQEDVREVVTTNHIAETKDKETSGVTFMDLNGLARTDIHQICSILNLPEVVSAPTTDNIMKHTEVDEPAVRNGVAVGADVTEGDMVKGKTDKGKKENKAPDPREAKKADEDESKEDAKDAEDDGPDVSAKDPKDDGTDVSNNIRDKGGGDGWEEMNNE